jgi:hypothetical protein
LSSKPNLYITDHVRIGGRHYFSSAFWHTCKFNQYRILKRLWGKKDLFFVVWHTRPGWVL